MSGRLLRLGALCTFLLAGCGSAAHGTAQSGATGPRSSSTAQTTPQGAVGPGGAPVSTTPGAGPRSGPGAYRGAAAGGARNVRIPATFMVRRGGTLAPRSVSSPAFLAIQLTVSADDGARHRVLVHTPIPHSLSLSPGLRASILIPGLRPGHYPIAVDGVVRGALEIGGEPGP